MSAEGDGTLRILVVDADAGARAQACVALRDGAERRCVFTEAASADAALREAGATPRPDCIVLDFDLPDGTALDVLARLPRDADRQTEVPVVVLIGAGRHDAATRRRVLQAGAQDDVGKSWLGPESLTRAVENAIQRHAMARDLHRGQRRRQLTAECAQAAAGGSEAELEGLFARVADALQADVVWDYGVEPGAAGRRLRLRASLGLDAAARARFAELAFDAALCGIAAETCAPVLRDHVQRSREPSAAASKALGIRAYAGFPLLVDGRLIGTLGFGSRRVDRFEADDLGLMAVVAHQAARVRERLRVDEELRRSESFNRSLVDSTADCVKVLDVQGRLLRINRAGLALLEADDGAALIGTSWPDLWPDDVKPRVVAAIAAAARGRPASFDGPGSTLKGTPRWWEVIVNPVAVEGGGPIERLVAISHDATQRRQRKDELQRSERRLSLAIEASGGFAFEWDPATDRVTRSSHATRLLGAAPGEADGTETGEAFFRCVDPTDRPRLVAAVHGLTPERPRYEVRYRVRRPDGIEVTFEEIASGTFDANGRLVRLVGMTVDRTAQIALEQALAAREHELRTLADNSPDILSRFDRGLRHVFVNAAVERATGHPPAWFVGRSNRELGMPTALCDRCDAALQAVFETGQPSVVAFAYPHPDGPTLFEATFVAERAVDGRIEHVLGVTRDVTERRLIDRRREELLEAERAARIESERVALIKDEFLATLSHELRTPLSAIVGWANVLKRSGAAVDVMRQGVDAIARNADMQAVLINDLLDMNRIVSGKLRLQVAPVDLNLVAAAAADTVRPAAQAKGVHFEMALAPPGTAQVQGDGARLQQVVWNLLSNAVKFTPSGGIVTLSTVCAGEVVELTVADTGQGIEPAFVPQLFDRFSQADGSAARVHGGLGLGLSIVKQLVELHGGSVAATSAGGGAGAAFAVRLPLAPPASDPRTRWTVRHAPRDDDFASTASPFFDGDADLGGISVMIVDDQADALELGRRVLAEYGATVFTAPSAAHALAQLRIEVPDVLLSDVGMPGMDGYELLAAVRSRLGLSAERLPAAALTAFVRPEDRARALQAGFQAYVEKPLRTQLLIRTVLELAQRRAGDEPAAADPPVRH